MPGNKILFVLYSSSQVDMIKTYLGDVETQNTTVVALTSDTQAKLKDEGIDFKTPNDYIVEKEYKKVDSDAWNLPMQWANLEISGTSIKKRLTYKELNLWNLIQYELYDFFMKYILKDIYTINRIIECEQPDEVVAVNYGHQGKIVSVICETKKIYLNLLSVSFINGIRDNFKILTSMDRTKIHSQSRALKFLFNCVEWQRRLFSKLPTRSIHKIKSQKTILMIAHAKNHIYVLKPIYEELKRNDTCSVDVICLDSIMNSDTAKELKKENIPYTIFESHIIKQIDIEVEKFNDQLEKMWHDFENDINFQKSLVYMDFSIWPVVKDAFAYFFATRQRFAEIVKYIETLELIYKSKKPNIIIATNIVVPFGKTAVCVGNALDIPTLYVQHAVISQHPSSADMPATKIAASGDFSKNVLLKYDVNPTKIVLTGQPKYDFLHDTQLNFNDNIYNQLAIKHDLGVIALTTQPHPTEDMVKLYRCVIGTMKYLTDKQLVIKLHPDEILSVRKKIIDKICAEFNVKNVKITKDINLYDVLNISEIILTEFSTTALEAMMLDKPVITINLTGEADRMPYAKSGAAIGVYDEQDLLPALESILHDENVRKELSMNRDKFVYDQTYKQDGNASKRVVKLINQMSENTNN